MRDYFPFEDNDIELAEFKDGTVELRLAPAAVGFLGPIGNMMRHYIPEVTAVREHRDPKDYPGLDTAQGQMAQWLLDEQINPAVGAHGGYISLVDVAEDIVYIRLEGGCQGCGMADVTLKQGVEVQIMQAVPSIRQVLDVTDHNSGDNPYYQPSK